MSHYCWKCGQYLANEKYSDKGHARYICKKCMAEVRAAFDKAHQESHVRMVIEHSLQLAEHTPECDIKFRGIFHQKGPGMYIIRPSNPTSVGGKILNAAAGVHIELVNIDIRLHSIRSSCF